MIASEDYILRRPRHRPGCRARSDRPAPTKRTISNQVSACVRIQPSPSAISSTAFPLDVPATVTSAAHMRLPARWWRWREPLTDAHDIEGGGGATRFSVGKMAEVKLEQARAKK
jgi:hypothetical protein